MGEHITADRTKGKDTRRGHTKGLRTVALFEAAKGVVVIMAGFGLLMMIHHDAQSVAEDVVRHLHLNPAHHFPRIFIAAVERTNDTRLWVLATGAAAYTVIRFVEAYGLWHRRVWAEWFGILSGSLYLPMELYALVVRLTPVKAAVLLVNLVVVGWLSWIRWRERESDN